MDIDLMEKQKDKIYRQKIKKAAELIKNSKHLVIFTGAGISTESGLPDFRGPNGVWTRRDKGLPPPRSKKPWHEVEPNLGHKIIVELQNMGIMKFLISQNVDNLHRKSGIKEEIIAEFHGNTTLMRCEVCEKKYNKKDVWDEKKWGPGYLTSKKKIGQPNCPNCGGRLVSTIVNFGDPIPQDAYKNSILHSYKADVFLVVGSSLLVTPAADMPKYAIKNNAKLIIINHQETPFDKVAEFRFFSDAGPTLLDIMKIIKKY